ncbi:MAG: hypothetical protein HY909_07310 [Deltaproteobacteria bacterium]|nr:hypothetical protein [Deltaproteobacteria bacterium]
MSPRAAPTAALLGLVAGLGCGPTAQVSIGSDLRDARADSASAPDTSPDTTAPADTTAPTDTSSGGLLRCAAPPECFGRCQPESRPCTCGMVPEGLRCVPACMLPRDCPLGPLGMPLACRMGACVP